MDADSDLVQYTWLNNFMMSLVDNSEQIRKWFPAQRRTESSFLYVASFTKESDNAWGHYHIFNNLLCLYSTFCIFFSIPLFPRAYYISFYWLWQKQQCVEFTLLGLIGESEMLMQTCSCLILFFHCLVSFYQKEYTN